MFLFCCIIFSFCSCKQRIEESNNITETPQIDKANIGLLLYTGEPIDYNASIEEMYKERTDVLCGKWSLTDGSVQMDEFPIFTVIGPSYFTLIESWDGEETFLINDQDQTVEKSSQKNSQFISYNYQTESRLGYGDGYMFEITPEQQRSMTLSDGAYIDFGNIDSAKDTKGEKILSGDLHLLGSYYNSEDLTVMFRYVNPDNIWNTKLIYLLLDTKTLQMSWSGLIEIPNEYIEELMGVNSRTSAFVEGKFYFSGGETVAYLDLKNDEIHGLEKITDRLDTLIPID